MDLKPAQREKREPVPEATSGEAIRAMLENLQRKGCLAGSEAAIEWVEAEIRRDIEDGYGDWA